MFVNEVLRRIFGPKWAEVAEGWGELYSAGLHNLHFHRILLGRPN